MPDSPEFDPDPSIHFGEDDEMYFYYKMREMRETRNRQRRLWASALTAFVAISLSFVTIFSLSKTLKGSFTKPSSSEVSESEFGDLSADVDQLKEMLAQLEETFDSLKTKIPESELAVKQSAIDAKLKGVTSKVSKLEDAILEDPSKALAVPLLQKDVRDLAIRHKDAKAASRAEFDRLYAQQTWMLSGIGTVLLAVAGASITMFIKSLPKNTNAEQGVVDRRATLPKVGD